MATTKKRGTLSSSHARPSTKKTPTQKTQAKKTTASPAPPETRCGTVALVGRPNVGKSTLVNALVGFRLSIVTPKPQTTRERILGVLTRGDAQLVFLDTPGLHKARNKLGAHMNVEAEEAARNADVVVYVTEVPQKPTLDAEGKILLERDETLARVLEIAGTDTPIVLAINKADRAKQKTTLLGLLEGYAKLHPFAAFVPIVAAKGGQGAANGLERLLDEVGQHLPRSPFLFSEDEITDRPERFLASEAIREKVFLATRDEIPYAVAVTIDAWEEPASDKGVTRIEATIHVEKDAQRRIVIGAGGDKVKQIGIAARRAIEELLGRRVHLGLYVRTEESWASDERKLAELGYETKIE